MTTPTLERDEEMITRLSRSFPRKQPLIALAILLVCILIGMFAVENSVKFYLYGIAGLCLGYVLVRGAVVFGMGAIMAGACASGCLTDIGEGYVRAMIALVTFILFSVPGEMARAALDATPLGASITVHLPDWFGYPGAILVSLIGFFVIYAMVWGYERKRKRESTVERVETPKELLPIPGDTDGRTDKFFGYRLWHNLFNTRWTFMTSAMMLAFLWIFILVTTHKAWGVTSAFTTWSVGFLRMLGIEFSADWAQSANAAIDGGLLNDGGTVRNLALLIGAAYALLLAGRFRFNTDFNVRDVTIYAPAVP